MKDWFVHHLAVVEQNKKVPNKPINEVEIILNGKIEYQKLPSGQTDYMEFYDENGERKLKLDDKGKPITRKEVDANGNEVEVDVYETREIDIKALIFGIKEMINEAIDIDNEINQLNQPLLTEKQVGRLITAMGIETATSKLNETVIESTKDDTPKNE